MGKLQSAVTLILRCESKFPKVKSLVSTHSACLYKNYLPRCSQIPHELIYFVFSRGPHTEQEKKLSRNHRKQAQLYAQMISSEAFSLTASALVTNHGYQNVEIAYKTIYCIFNLNSLSVLMKPFCLNEHFNTLDVICLTIDYAIASFPLVMIALIYFAIRCISRFRCPRRHRNLVLIFPILLPQFHHKLNVNINHQNLQQIT